MYTLPPISLWHACLQLNIDNTAIACICAEANITEEQFDEMLVTEKPVTRDVAHRLLAALSKMCGYPLTLDNVKIAILR